MVTPAIEKVALPVLILPAFDGSGISTTAIVGSYTKSVEINGRNIVIVNQLANGDEQRETYVGLDDGAGLSQAEVEALIAPYALATSPSGTIPDALIPSNIARDTEIPPASGLDPQDVGTMPSPGSATAYSRSDHVHRGGAGGTGGQTVVQVNSLIATALQNATTGNTETGIAVSYQTTDNTIDFVVNGAQVANLLNVLTGASRLSYTALRDTPTIPTPPTEATDTQITDEDGGVYISPANFVRAFQAVEVSDYPAGIARDTELPQPSNVNPLSDAGTASQGTSTRYSRQDHQHQEVNTGRRTTDANIDARIADWARVGFTGDIPDARIPSGIARDSELPQPADALPLLEGTANTGSSTRYARQDHVHPGGGGTGGLSVSQVDARIAAWARLGNNDPFPDSKAPTTIARTSAIPSPSNVTPLIEGTATQGTSPRYSRQDHVHPQSTARVTTDANIDSRIATWAKANSPSGTIPDSLLPSDVAKTSAIPMPATDTPVQSAQTGVVGTSTKYAREDHRHAGDGVGTGSGSVSFTAIDARIATWARANSPSGTIPDGFIPAGIARDSEIPSAGTGTPAQVANVGAVGSSTAYSRADHVHQKSDLRTTTDTQIDARIATWARANSPTGMIPDASIPSSIARDTELPQASNADPLVEGTASQGVSARYSRQDHVHPQGSGITQAQADARVGALVDDWAEVANTTTLIPDSKIPASIARDSEIPLASNSNPNVDGTANQGSSVRYSRQDHVHPRSTVRNTSNSDIDDRVATWARANSPSGTVPDNRIPASIARDSELPQPSNAVPLVEGTGNSGSSTRYSRQDHVHPAGSAGLDTAGVDGRIATWARANSPSGTIPDARIPASIARDSEIPSAANTVPLVDTSGGTIGIGTRYARSDHAHPTSQISADQFYFNAVLVGNQNLPAGITNSVWADTSIDIPNGSHFLMYLFFGGGAAYDRGVHIIRTSDLLALPAQTVGSTLSSSQALFQHISGSLNNQQLNFYFGRTSANRLLIAEAGVGFDLSGLNLQVYSIGGILGQFTGLSDTPANYTGQAGKILQVNSGANGLEFTDKPSGGTGSTTFVALTDTPSSFGTAGQILQVNTARNALEWVNAPTGGTGTTTFIGLTDTPANFTSSANKYLQVNSTGTAITFVDAPSGGPVVSTTAIYVAVASSTTASTFNAADFTNATRSATVMGESITFPNWTGNRFIAVAIPNDENMTGFELDGLNQASAFTLQSGTLTINSATYKWYRSDNKVNISGTTVEIKRS